MKKILIIILVIALLLGLTLTIFADQIFGYNLIVEKPSYVSMPLKKRYKPGDEVVIIAWVWLDCSIQCIVNGTNIGFPTYETIDEKVYWKFSFTMPDCDTTVSFKDIFSSPF